MVRGFVYAEGTFSSPAFESTELGPLSVLTPGESTFALLASQLAAPPMPDND